jgi:hypothetical protein
MFPMKFDSAIDAMRSISHVTQGKLKPSLSSIDSRASTSQTQAGATSQDVATAASCSQQQQPQQQQEIGR